MAYSQTPCLRPHENRRTSTDFSVDKLRYIYEIKLSNKNTFTKIYFSPMLSENALCVLPSCKNNTHLMDFYQDNLGKLAPET